MNKSFYQTIIAVATLTGTIIGVGMFALPYVAAKVGIWTMLAYFIVLGAITILTHLMAGEVALRTKQICRLPGYTGKYLGKRAGQISLLVSILGLVGANLAYLVVGGGFLHAILSPVFGGAVFVYVFIFFAAGAFLVFADIKSIAQTELILAAVFLAILAIIFYKGYFFISVSYLFNFEPEHFFLPYGAILFSLSGLSLVPEIKEIMTENPANLKKVISISVIIAAIIYLFFTVLVLGLTGPQTSVEAVAGLKIVFGDGLAFLAFILGALTTFTSHIALGLTVKKILWHDLRLGKSISWALACFLPFILYLLGFNNFIAIISLTGGVALGLQSILIIFTYLKAKKKSGQIPAYNLNIPIIVIWLTVLALLLGVVYQVLYFA